MRIVLVSAKRPTTAKLTRWLTQRGHAVRRLSADELQEVIQDVLRADLVMLGPAAPDELARTCRLLEKAGAPTVVAGVPASATLIDELLDAGVKEIIEAPLERARFNARMLTIEHRLKSRADGSDRPQGPESGRRLEDQQLHTLLEAIPERLMFKDRESRYVWVNQVVLNDLGAEDLDAVAGKRAADFLPEDIAWQVAQDEQRIFDTGEPLINAERRFLIDGKESWHLTTKMPTFDAAGEITGLVAIIRDITERKLADDALRLSEATWRALVTSVPDQIVMIDRDAKILFINRTRSQMDTDSVIGRKVFDFILPGYHKKVRADVKRVFRTAEVVTSEAEAVGTGGRTSWIASRIGPVWKDGQVVAAVVVNADITTRREAEEELRRREELYRTLAANIPDLTVLLFDRELCTTVAEGPGLVRFGTTSDRIEGRSLADLLPLEMRESGVAACAAALDGEHSSFEIDIGGRDYLLHALPVRNDRREIFAGMLVAHDVTERGQAETELRAHALQQAEVARFGQRALAGEDPSELMAEAVRMVARTLRVARCDILQHQPEQDRLLLIAGAGWDESEIGHASKPTDPSSYAGFALQRGEPVVVEDLSGDRRFDAPPLLEARGTVSSVSVIVQGPNAPYGLLRAHATTRRAFSQDDVHFLQAVANVLAAAIERKEAESLISHMAFHDPLTGLPNRLLFNDRFRMALTRARRNGEMLGVLFIDLDAFKLVNDSLGHAVGDRVLPMVAARLRDSLRDADTIARVGGDEFVVLVPEPRTAADAGVTAGRVLAALRPAFDLDGYQIAITASIGVSIYPDDGTDRESLLRRADARMYLAKDAGGGRHVGAVDESAGAVSGTTGTPKGA